MESKLNNTTGSNKITMATDQAQHQAREYKLHRQVEELTNMETTQPAPRIPLLVNLKKIDRISNSSNKLYINKITTFSMVVWARGLILHTIKVV